MLYRSCALRLALCNYSFMLIQEVHAHSVFSKFVVKASAQMVVIVRFIVALAALAVATTVAL